MPSKNNVIKFNPKEIAQWFSVSWVLLLLVPLVSFIPQPATQFGHPWKTELFSSFFILLVIIASLVKTSTFQNFKLDSSSIMIAIFIFWSGLSFFWAESWNSVAHHTLVWSLYFVFFTFAKEIIQNKQLFRLSLLGLILFTWIISISCIIGYTSIIYDAKAESTFRTFYSKFSEILVSLIPLFIAITLVSRKKIALLFGFTATIGWLAILLSLNRASFLALSISCLILLPFIFIFFDYKKLLKRGLLLACGFILCFVFSQLPLSNSNDATLYGRATSTSAYQQSSSQVRILLWKVGLFMSQQNLLFGVGADNFGITFNQYREEYFNQVQFNQTEIAAEDSMLERTHNEYLQISAELGLIGLGIFSIFILVCGKTFFGNLKCEKHRIYLILKIGSFIGLIGFLISSFASSFSFRAMQNGFVFFFLLAIALHHKKLKQTDYKTVSEPKSFKPWLVGFASFACVCLMLLTIFQVTSNYYLANAEKNRDFTEAEPYYQKAIDYNPENATAYFALGLRFYTEKQTKEAAKYMKIGVEKGLNTSFCYYYLASAQHYAGESIEAEKTLAKSVKIYPHSLFLRNSYAILLEKNGKSQQAQKEIELAEQINLKHSKVWQSILMIGAEETTYIIRKDKNLPEIMDLLPINGVYSIVDEQNLYNPKGNRVAELLQ